MDRLYWLSKANLILFRFMRLRRCSLRMSPVHKSLFERSYSNLLRLTLLKTDPVTISKQLRSLVQHFNNTYSVNRDNPGYIGNSNRSGNFDRITTVYNAEVVVLVMTLVVVEATAEEEVVMQTSSAKFAWNLAILQLCVIIGLILIINLTQR